MEREVVVDRQMLFAPLEGNNRVGLSSRDLRLLLPASMLVASILACSPGNANALGWNIVLSAATGVEVAFIAGNMAHKFGTAVVAGAVSFTLVALASAVSNGFVTSGGLPLTPLVTAAGIPLSVGLCNFTRAHLD